MSSELLKKDFDIQKPLADAFLSEFLHQFGVLVRSTKVTLGVPVEGRVKTWESIGEKIDRNLLSLTNCKELSDFVGVRVITLFKRDVDKLCRLVEKTFPIESKEDKATGLGTNTFGYISRHFIVTIPRAWRKVPAFKGQDFRIEVQIRTGAQHIWAAASHLLQYKKEADVPPQVSRSIYRVAALLETVDLEFERVLDERTQYSKSEGALAPAALLDTDNLRLVLDERLPAENRISVENYSALLEDLNAFKIQTVASLGELIKQQMAPVKEKEAKIVANFKAGVESEYSPSSPDRLAKGVYFTHVGLVRKMLSSKFGKDFDIYLREKARVRRKLQLEQRNQASVSTPPASS
jgi:ppGpp synthetase/RelA/SpoT-type nucleotidyltranferase